MSKRILLILLLSCGLAGAAQREGAGKGSAAGAAGVEKQLEVYASRFLAWDPQSKITVTKSTESVSGFQSFKIKRTAKYEKLNVDRVVYVSDDGKWFFAGDALPNTAPRPVRGSHDLAWLDDKLGKLFRTSVHAVMTPDRDAAGLKGVAL